MGTRTGPPATEPEAGGFRPPKPPPLDVLSERSKAAWRKYLRDCAFADERERQAKARRDGR